MYKTRVVDVAVSLQSSGLNSDDVTHIRIDDEGGGEFVSITQYGVSEEGTVRLDDYDEWKAIKAAVEEAFCEISEAEVPQPTAVPEDSTPSRGLDRRWKEVVGRCS